MSSYQKSLRNGFFEEALTPVEKLCHICNLIQNHPLAPPKPKTSFQINSMWSSEDCVSDENLIS